MTAYLVITGILFLIFGLRALFDPIGGAAVPYSLGADHVDAKNFLRAGAGGVSVSFGLTCIVAPAIPLLILPALILVLVLLGGLLLGRSVSFFIDGAPGKLIRYGAIGELVGLVFGFYWLSEHVA